MPLQDGGTENCMMVSIWSIVCMAISMVVSIGVPILLFFYFRKKCGGKGVPMLLGAIAFVVFALILERLVHAMVLHPDAEGNIALKSRPILYMLYGGFMAGIFEETARFISMHILKSKYQGIGTALSYGVGHGGAESVLIAGLGMLSSLIFGVMLNAGQTFPQMEAAITALTTTPSYLFLISGTERMLALCLQISLSVLVWYAVVRKDRVWLFPAAILLHAVVDFPAALYQTGVISNIFAVEGIILVISLLCALLARYVYKKSEQIPAQDAAV